MKGELLQDLNQLIQNMGIMRDSGSIDELDRYYSMIRKKLKEVYKVKREMLKKEKKLKKKKDQKAEDL